MNIRPLGVLSAALATVLAVGVISCTAAPAHADTGTGLALIKSNDLATVGHRFASNFQWIACGRTTGRSCKKGPVPVYTSYWALKAAIDRGALKKVKAVLFDQETWGWTPKREQAKPARYARLVSQLARAHGVYLIFTAVERGMSAELAVDAAAAPYASAVAVQSQRYDGNPAKFRRFINRAVDVLAAVNPRVPVIAGLATDAGGVPVSFGDMAREYRAAYPLVDGIWLNAAQWTHGKGCAPKGCGATGRKFLQWIDALVNLGK